MTQLPEASPQDKILDKATGQSELHENAHDLGALAIHHSDTEALEGNEVLIDVVRKHYIGIVGLVTQAVIGGITLIAITLLGIYSFFPEISTSTKGAIVAGGMFVTALFLVFILIQIFVYRKSKIIITNESLVQVLQKAPFNRKISRLSMGNVEDVTLTQRGILASILGYGTLNIQTAGEMENFTFDYCPNPDLYAHIILEARQNYVTAHKND